MVRYSVQFTRSARKELEILEVKILERIFFKIEALATDPIPRTSKKIKGEKGLWRIRVGDYRVIYCIDNKNHMVDILTVRHRQEAYK